MRTRYRHTNSSSVYLGQLLTYRRRDVYSPWYLYQTTTYSHDPAQFGRPYSSWICTRDELHKGPPYRNGGPFLSVKMDIADFLRPQPMYGKLTIWPNQYQVYEGGMIPNLYPASPYVATSSWTSIDSTAAKQFLDATDYGISRGPTGYNKFIPVKPQVELGQLVAEVREIPAMFYSTAKHFLGLWNTVCKKHRYGRYKMSLMPKDIADEWLNSQFGWVPFLSTVRDFYSTTRVLNRHISRLRKYNGKWERRGGLLHKEVGKQSTVKAGIAGIIPQMSTYFGATNTRPYVIQQELFEKTWFSAEYKYYIPALESASRYPFAVMSHLYGMDVTPSMLWQIMPWTWLTDWVFDVTSLLKANEDPYGQCVSKNAWVMSTTGAEFVFETTVPLAGTTNHGRWVCSASRKSRKGATHYGFDVPYSELSPWRLSILSALGLSKSKARWQAGM